MTPCIEEAHRLLRLAQRDLHTFSILASHPESPLEAMCFHAQQCAEKALKAVLTSRCLDFPPTHNLQTLAKIVVEQGVDLPLPVQELRRLNPYAVETRYNDEMIPLLTKDEAGGIAASSLSWAQALVAQAEV